MKVCAEPGCPNLQPESRCPEHRSAREKARGTRQERGYDAAHEQERKRYASYIEAGVTITCARCKKPISTDEPWDLGHDDHDRSRWTGPEHVRCNRATAGRRISPDA